MVWVKIAIVDGYQRFNDEITWAVVAIIIVLVQLVQFISNSLAEGYASISLCSL